MNFNVSVFQEPRGVMRVIQFIFSICAFATTTNFSGLINLVCRTGNEDYGFSYPFVISFSYCNNTQYTTGDFSSDAQFFVTTGVLSFLYCIFVLILYVCFDELYKNKKQIPLTDFLLTVVLAVFWLSGSAAWANGVNGLKNVADVEGCSTTICQTTQVSSFSGLNISIILGFLNFFLWASDLWFLYKETAWFQLKNAAATESRPTTPTV